MMSNIMSINEWPFNTIVGWSKQVKCRLSETEAGHNYSLLSCHRMSKHKQTEKVWVEKEENISTIQNF